MLEFFRALARERAFEVRLPGLVLSFLIAEFFYKFHSFTLECRAFTNSGACCALARATAVRGK